MNKLHLNYFSLQCHISLTAGNINTVADMGWSLWGGGSSWVFCLVWISEDKNFIQEI